MFCRSVKRVSETEEEREFLKEKEKEAVAAAALVAALGRSDADYIYEHLMPSSSTRPLQRPEVQTAPAGDTTAACPFCQV